MAVTRTLPERTLTEAIIDKINSRSDAILVAKRTRTYPLVDMLPSGIGERTDLIVARRGILRRQSFEDFATSFLLSSGIFDKPGILRNDYIGDALRGLFGGSSIRNLEIQRVEFTRQVATVERRAGVLRIDIDDKQYEANFGAQHSPKKGCAPGFEIRDGVAEIPSGWKPRNDSIVKNIDRIITLSILHSATSARNYARSDLIPLESHPMLSLRRKS